MDFNFTIAPQLPLWLIVTVALVSGLLVLFGMIRQIKGAWIRAVAWAIVMLAMLNPSLLREEREPLKSVVAVVVDKSASQKLDERGDQTDAILAQVRDNLAKLGEFEVREAVAEDNISATSDATTTLFNTLNLALQDVPSEQVAGGIFITDGQVHDIPETKNSLGFDAPLHALITGQEDEKDRRIALVNAPKFGVVGESHEIIYRVDEVGFENGGRPLDVTILFDGEVVSIEEVLPGEEASFVFDVPHGGKNIVELVVEADEDEITDINNHIFTNINGIRENLRVLLVSGEPHAGERTWRNLLKSDASVDLVHFTILRPPEKQDGTPINQLSLIAFPTRELFVQKIDEFDLIIFDRYQRRGVLPVLYFDNIARYVREGGAVMIAAGPEYANQGSIGNTPLNVVLPGVANGLITEAPFKPRVPELGQKHPVTRNLDGWNPTDPDWSRWFRSVGIDEVSGEVVMTNESDEPLLMLHRAEEGRVALFLSDHVWLWARGFEGGGPHVQLLRRIAHWLMKEPELDEERLTAEARGDKVTISRQSIGDTPDDITLKGPTGEELKVPLSETQPGVFSAEVTVKDIGLYQAESGDLLAITQVGPANPREFSEVVSKPELLAPLLEATGGSAERASPSQVPRIVAVRSGATSKGRGWIGLHNTQASVLTGVDRIPLFSGLLGLALLLLALSGMWAREGR